MTYTSQQIDLVINKLKREQFEKLKLSSLVVADQFYYITDDTPTETLISRAISAYYKIGSQKFTDDVSAMISSDATYVFQNEVKGNLEIYKVTRAQYEALKAAGQIKSSAYYYILDDATVEQKIQGALSTYYDKTEISQISSTITQKIDNKVKVGIYGQSLSALQTLSVITINADDYHKLVSEGKVDPTVLYILSSDQINAYDKTIVNVASPELSSDAANRQYVDEQISAIPLSDYYTKSETSSYSQISDEFKKYQLSGNYLSSNALENYYQKSETSSANDISTGLDTRSKVTITDSTIGLSGEKVDLKVKKVTLDEYAKILDAHTQQELSDTLFIVSSDTINAFYERIINVGTPLSSTDAATKGYVDENIPQISIATSSTYGIVKPDNTTISVNNGIMTAIGGGSGGYSFDIYHPTYDSTNNLYVIKSGKFNIINELVKNDCNLIFEDYSLNNIYKVALSTVSNTSCAINLLVDTTVNGVAGAYEDDITEQLKVLSPNQAYSFEVSYGNVILDNDSPMYSIRDMKLIRDYEGGYGYGYEDYWFDIYPVNESMNTVTFPTGSSPLKYSIKIPGAQTINGNKKARDFTVKFKGTRGNAPIVIEDKDVHGKSLGFELDEDVEWSDLSAPDSSLWYYSFTETEENTFLVGMRNLKSK